MNTPQAVTEPGELSGDVECILGPDLVCACQLGSECSAFSPPADYLAFSARLMRNMEGKKAWKCTRCMQYLGRSEEGVRSPRTGVRYCKPPCRC